MAVTVRRATKEDAKRVAELALKLFAQHHDYDEQRFAKLSSIEGAERFYRSRSETPDAAVFVAEIDNEIVGMAYLQYEALDYSNLLENAVWLHDIYIEETARATGTGKLLIENSIKTAKDLGADKLMLSVAAKNGLAREFFSRRGFRETMIEMMLDLNDA